MEGMFVVDIDAILSPLNEFFSTGLGRIVKAIVEALYSVIYPSNAEAASNATVDGAVSQQMVDTVADAASAKK